MHCYGNNCLTTSLDLRTLLVLLDVDVPSVCTQGLRESKHGSIDLLCC